VVSSRSLPVWTAVHPVACDRPARTPATGAWRVERSSGHGGNGLVATGVSGSEPAAQEPEDRPSDDRKNDSGLLDGEVVGPDERACSGEDGDEHDEQTAGQPTVGGLLGSSVARLEFVGLPCIGLAGGDLSYSGPSQTSRSAGSSAPACGVEPGRVHPTGVEVIPWFGSLVAEVVV
jgi:hypothetical protein